MVIRNAARQDPAHALPPESQQSSATIHVGQEAISLAEQATEASNLTAHSGAGDVIFKAMIPNRLNYQVMSEERAKVIWDELQIGRREDSMDIIRTRLPR